jgi:hypothetical protein
MLINHNEKSLKEYQSFAKKSNLMNQMTTLQLIWGLMQMLFRHGNQKIYYHICGYEDTWDCPMEAEGLGLRKTGTGEKLTLW